MRASYPLASAVLFAAALAAQTPPPQPLANGCTACGDVLGNPPECTEFVYRHKPERFTDGSIVLDRATICDINGLVQMLFRIADPAAHWPLVPMLPPGTAGTPIAAPPQASPIQANQVWNETHVVDAAGVNASVPLAHPPLAGSTLVFKNSYLMVLGRDYDLDAAGAIAFRARQRLFAGDVVVANYQWRGP
jgi:hypothetical protein